MPTRGRTCASAQENLGSHNDHVKAPVWGGCRAEQIGKNKNKEKPMTPNYKARRAAKHAAERVITSAELAAAHAAAPSDYKGGGNIVWQRGMTDELTCQLLVFFVLWNQPRAQWFKASSRAITLTFPSMKANGTVQCTLDPQAYSTMLSDTIGRQHFNNIMLEHKVKSWMQTHQSGEPALLCTFTCGFE